MISSTLLLRPITATRLTQIKVVTISQGSRRPCPRSDSPPIKGEISPTSSIESE